MIFFVSTHTHRYTHAAMAKARDDLRRVSYPWLFARPSLPRGTYIFSDFDRLGFFQLELAANIYRVLEAAGCPVLNDPARVLHRLAFLQRLHRLGINSFKAWPASDADLVDRFPIFLRTASAHRGVLTDLIADTDTLADALEETVQRGFPLNDLMIVEYCAQPIRDDVYRKLAVYRIGDTLVPSASVHERSWTAKSGQDNVAGAQGYAEDLALVRDNPHSAVLRRAFDAASVTYGRADFGIVDGRPEIYEINTNPMVRALRNHANADRAEAMRLTHHRYHEALSKLPKAETGAAIRISKPVSYRPFHAYQRLFPGFQWLP